MSSYLSAALHAPDDGDSYSAAWGEVHARLASEDEQRREYLNARAYRETSTNQRHRGGRVLTDAQAAEIRTRAQTEVAASLAEEFGVSKETISKIKNGRRYRGAKP